MSSADDEAFEAERIKAEAENSASAAAAAPEESTFQRLVMNNLSDFFKESIRFLKGCKTPGDQPFAMVLGMTGVGALGMGLISFVVKVVHIPLTQVLVLKTE